jgi:hypothetical protein
MGASVVWAVRENAGKVKRGWMAACFFCGWGSKDLYTDPVDAEPDLKLHPKHPVVEYAPHTHRSTSR